MIRPHVSPFLLAAIAGLPALSPAATLLELTGGYDVLVEGDMSLNGVHMHGATGVGGNLALSGDITEFLNDPVTRPAGLTVAGSIALGADGRINNSGKLHVGTPGANQSVNDTPGSSALNDSDSGKNIFFSSGQSAGDVSSLPSGFDVAGSFGVLRGLSSSLAAMSSTLSFGDYTSGQNFSFTLGSGSGLDVFNITGAQLAQVTNLNFGHLAGFTQQLVINVDLTGYTGGAFTQNRNGEQEANNILWNFYGADSLSLSNQFIGSILAPDLSLTHNNNDIKGTVIAESFTKNGGQVHIHDFTTPDSTPDPVPDGGSTALFALLVAPLLGWFKRRAA